MEGYGLGRSRWRDAGSSGGSRSSKWSMARGHEAPGSQSTDGEWQGHEPPPNQPAGAWGPPTPSGHPLNPQAWMPGQAYWLP